MTGNTPIFDSAALFAVPGISTVTVPEIGGAGPGYRQMLSCLDAIKTEE